MLKLGDPSGMGIQGGNRWEWGQGMGSLFQGRCCDHRTTKYQCFVHEAELL